MVLLPTVIMFKIACSVWSFPHDRTLGVSFVRDYPAVITVVMEGKVGLNPFVTGRIALEDLVEQGSTT